MSLINKMLQDLEARQETSSSPATPVYQDLRPVGAGGRKGSWRLLALLVCVFGLGVAIYFAAERAGFTLVSSTVVAAPLTKTPAPAVESQSQNAAAPVVAPSVPALTIHEEPNPAVPAKAEPQPVVVAAAAPVPVTADKKPAAVVTSPTSRPNADSQKKAQVSIVKAGEPVLAPVKKALPKPPPTTLVPPRKSVAVMTPAPVAVVDKKIRPFTAEEKADARYRRAVRFLDQGRTEDAIGQLREALREQPGHLKARELAAGLALQSGHWREAESLLEEGLRQVPSQYLFARMLARVYVDHGAEAKALAVMESAEPHGSDDPDFSSLLGLLYQRSGRHADAVEVYKRALALRPDDARTWLGFAISLEGAEQWGAAKSAYQRAKANGGLTPPLLQYAEQRLAALKDR